MAAISQGICVATMTAFRGGMVWSRKAPLDAAGKADIVTIARTDRRARSAA
jgi:hypothetical protein